MRGTHCTARGTARARIRDHVTVFSLALALSACGSGGSSGGGGPILSSSPTPSPTSGSATCSLRARQDWVLAQFNEWYLFPDTLTYVNPAAFAGPTDAQALSDYVDALAAGARAQGRDRYFSYVTSIAGEDAYYQTGETAGMGVRLHVDNAARRLRVSEAFENAPALSAGIDRATEILGIGTSAGNIRSVSDILSTSGEAGLYSALGPSTVGYTVALDVQDASGRRTVTVTKANYNITPVSSRYGVRVLDDGGHKVGYINLRTFIYSAQPALRAAFGQLKAQGVADVIVDLRYNGGGLISVAQTLGSLLGGAQHSSDVFARLTYRPEKTAENENYYFQAETNAIAPRRIAFIGTEDTASASELVINAFRPYLHTDVALIGSNTYGKPVGQIALDQSACDDRLRLIAFAVQNADGQGGYFQGLAPVMEASCEAPDDVTQPLGDLREASVARAVDYLDGRPCTSLGGTTAVGKVAAPAALTRALHALRPAEPSEPQRDMPGLF